jgi:hypothetical protein
MSWTNVDATKHVQRLTGGAVTKRSGTIQKEDIPDRRLIAVPTT